MFKRLLAGFCLALLLLPPAEALALGPDSDRVYQGLDVSAYQGEIDFEELRSAGKSLIYIRAGQGADYQDPYFQQNAAGAKEAGLHFGFYLYVTAKDESQAREQARFFAGLIEGSGYDCRPAMDFEDFSGLSVSTVNAIGRAFMEELESLTGYAPLLYTDAYAADSIWDESFGKYPLWAAEYGPEEPIIEKDYWQGWSGFQYSSEGRVPGIAVDVDLDKFTGSVLIEPQPEPEPQPGGRTHVVEKCQTLAVISRMYGVSVEAIAERNGIADVDLIYIGQLLYIPGAEKAPEYTVSPGDCLWSISQRCGLSVEELVRLNDIADPQLIHAGDVLRIG